VCARWSLRLPHSQLRSVPNIANVISKVHGERENTGLHNKLRRCIRQTEVYSARRIHHWLLRVFLALEGVALFDALLFLAHTGLRRTLTDQPLGRAGKELLDFGGGEGVGDTATGKTGCGDTEFARDDLAGVGAGQAKLHKPFRRGGQQFVQKVTGDRAVLEIFRGCGKVDSQLLCGGRRLHGLRRSFLIHPDSVTCPFDRDTRGSYERTPVDVTLLQHFVAVAEQLHFTRAAKSLNISRQALSTSVKSLEAELGVELFDRAAETTTLSAAGQNLLGDALPLIEAESARIQAELDAAALPATLSISFVPGVTVGKWTTAWETRHPGVELKVRPTDEDKSVRILRDGIADLAFVRLPVKEHGLSIIPLYKEVPVIVAPKDHPIAAFDELTLDDIRDETVVVNPGSVADAVELVAAGVGLLKLPQSIARLHARKDVVARPLVDAATTEIAIVWMADELTADMEEFVGIVRGRTAASSRATAGLPGTKAAPEASAPAAPAKKATGSGGQAPKAPKVKKPQVKHSRGALQARNRKRGGGR